ncbi:MAG TPA: hypothetical protein VFQ40_03370 [Actinomycetota bacterium]|nr:hypothetical protein [Actinomycetota bacterium]
MRAIHHDTDSTTTATRAVDTAPSPWLAVRVILTVAAAVLLLTGSFLDWTGGNDGSALAVQHYWDPDAGTEGFLASAGLVTAICGAVIILGLAFRGGWLQRFAGAVALVAFTLMLVQMGRSGELNALGDIGIGLWFVLAGGALALLGGFLPTTRTVAATERTVDTDADDDHPHGPSTHTHT